MINYIFHHHLPPIMPASCDFHIKGNIDLYYLAGVKLIYCHWNYGVSDPQWHLIYILMACIGVSVFLRAFCAQLFSADTPRFLMYSRRGFWFVFVVFNACWISIQSRLSKPLGGIYNTYLYSVYLRTQNVHQNFFILCQLCLRLEIAIKKYKKQ